MVGASSKQPAIDHSVQSKMAGVPYRLEEQLSFGKIELTATVADETVA
jgi:hypothetical protein